jgi:hypothetical protein
LAAVSIASPPPLARNTFAPGTGASAERRRVSSTAGRFAKSPNVWYVASSRICAATASAISCRPCPTLTHHRLAVASR